MFILHLVTLISSEIIIIIIIIIALSFCVCPILFDHQILCFEDLISFTEISWLRGTIIPKFDLLITYNCDVRVCFLRLNDVAGWTYQTRATGVCEWKWGAKQNGVSRIRPELPRRSGADCLWTAIWCWVFPRSRRKRSVIGVISFHGVDIAVLFCISWVLLLDERSICCTMTPDSLLTVMCILAGCVRQCIMISKYK